jgi:hypothetical protein
MAHERAYRTVSYIAEDKGAWLTARFLISTHYTRYDWRLFGLNFAALVFVLFPKLPSVSLAPYSFCAMALLIFSFIV